MHVSIVLVRALLSEVRSRGLPASALLAGAAIREQSLNDLRATISTHDWATLLLRAREITRDPAVGLALGESSPSTLQVVGHLIASCRTLRESLQTLQSYHCLLSSNTVWTLEERDDKAFFFCDDQIRNPIARRISLEATLALGYRIGHMLVAQASDEAWFQFAEPAHLREYARVFGCPLRFSQPRNALVFARSLLDVTLPHGDETTRATLVAAADTLLCERNSERMTERVRAMLRYEHDLALIGPEWIAERLNMNIRGIRRRLRAEGSSLADLLQEARIRFAQHELAKPEAVIKEIAHSLGYSEASAFHRAFKRWTGQGPATFINEKRGSRKASSRIDRP